METLTIFVIIIIITIIILLIKLISISKNVKFIKNSIVVNRKAAIVFEKFKMKKVKNALNEKFEDLIMESFTFDCIMILNEFTLNESDEKVKLLKESYRIFFNPTLFEELAIEHKLETVYIYCKTIK